MIPEDVRRTGITKLPLVNSDSCYFPFSTADFVPVERANRSLLTRLKREPRICGTADTPKPVYKYLCHSGKHPEGLRTPQPPNDYRTRYVHSWSLE